MARVRRLGKTFRYVLKTVSPADSLRFSSGSEIIHFDIFGSSVVVVNSAEAAHELFEKRSLIYSDRLVQIICHNFVLLTGQSRPRMPMLNEMFVFTMSAKSKTSHMATVSDIAGILPLFPI